MISKEAIREELVKIAANNGLYGESVNLIIDTITYALYHEQFEIINMVQENNLATAKLMNSKIRSCMNVMYPVYRGKNARVKLNFVNNTLINKNKFDVLFTSNTFRVYAENSINLTPSLDGGNSGIGKYTVIGILSTKDLQESTKTIKSGEEYYVDFTIDREIVSNLSEDVQVFVNGTEYPVTRSFYDYIQSDIPLNNNDAYLIGSRYHYVNGVTWVSIPETDPKVADLKIRGELDSSTSLPILPSKDLDPLFILTIPDYGIRVFKRGYFKVNDSVTIRALKYTTADQINSDEFSRIIIPGTELTTPISKSNLVRRSPSLNKEGKPDYLDNGIIREIARDDERSLLINANNYSRLQNKTLAKSDINALFTEHFIDQVHAAINWYDGKKDPNTLQDTVSFDAGTVYIYYVPKVDNDFITVNQMDVFKQKYGSYFITNTLKAESGILLTIDVQMVIVTKRSVDLSSSLENIFTNYSMILNDPNDKESNVLKPKLIFSEISKLPDVDYIDSLEYTQARSLSDTIVLGNDVLKNLPSHFDGIPTYYKFNLNTTYKLTYEV
jgi:hypothetical protein